MATSYQILTTLDKERWRQFVERQPAGNVFHTPEMFQVMERAKGYRPTIRAVVNDADHVLALLLPVQVTVKGGLLRHLTTRAVAYGSVLFEASREGQDALATLLSAYTQDLDREVLFTELRNLADLSPVQPTLNASGFLYEDHLNYLIDLDRPVEEVMQSIGQRTRKHIRKGLRKGDVTVREVSEPSEVALCYDLIRQSYLGAGVPLADFSLFEAAFDILHPRGMVKFWLAEVEQKWAAASVELLYKDVMYGWYGGIDRAFGKYLPGEMLMWYILQWGTEHGYRRYDFGGAGKPDEDYGVRDFKAKFGGELVCFGRNTAVHAPVRLFFSRAAYNLLQRLQRSAAAMRVTT